MVLEDTAHPDNSNTESQPIEDLAQPPVHENEPQREPIGLAAYEEEIKAADDIVEEVVAPVPCDVKERLPEYMMKIVDARIMAWVKLLSLEDSRKKLRKHSDDRKISDELARQDRETKRVPSDEQLKQTRPRLVKQYDQATSDLKAYEAETTRLRNEAMEKARLEGVPLSRIQVDLPSPPVPRHLPLALKMGISQIDILIQRNRIALRLPEAANSLYLHEPLWKLARRFEIQSEHLFEWIFLSLGIEKRRAEYKEQEKKQREELNAWKSTHSRHSFLKRDKHEEDEPVIDPKVILRRIASERELAAIEKEMVDRFWDLHEEIAWLLVSQDLPDDEKRVARAFLRYGITSTRKDAIQPEKLAAIYRLCIRDVSSWNNTSSERHIVYPDEFYQALYERKTTPSPDEELELNNRHSDEWKADRVWRQYIVGKSRLEIFEAMESSSDSRVEELQKKQGECDKQLQELKSQKDQESRKQREKIEELMMNVRMQLGKENKVVELLRDKIVPDLKESLRIIENRLTEAEKVMDMEYMIRREAKFVRRMARLLARLKEPFLPFVVRDYLDVDREDHHSRATTLEVVEKLEKADSRIFDHILMTHRKLDKRITVRTPPVHLLIPCRGQMSMSICPRRSNDFGRLILPLMGQRQGMLEKLLCDIMADFRWDCSMEEAGIDWLMADALCAGYATVRWDYRKKNEQTQKRAGIEKKSKDRQNFRVHYNLYVLSMDECGKKLFQKCNEIYQVCTKYLGLPPGKTALKRD